MRIATAQYYETTAANYQRNFNKAIATSDEASSLTRINTAADDPLGAGRLLELGQQSAMLSQYSGNISTTKSALSLQETTLDSIGTALQRAKEIALSANNGIATDDDRKAYAAELNEIKQQVLGLMNSRIRAAITCSPVRKPTPRRTRRIPTAPTPTTVTRAASTWALAMACRWRPTPRAGTRSSSPSIPAAPRPP